MTAVESQMNDSLLRPTDLSLKGLNSKCNKGITSSPSPNTTPPQLIDYKLPYIIESHNDCEWRNKVKSEPRTLPSPVALAYHTASRTSMAPSVPLDSMARLVVLESIFSRNRYSPPPVYDHVALAHGLARPPVRSNSNEKTGISQPILEAAKSLTQLQHGGVNGEQRFLPNHEPASQTTTKKPCKRRGGWKFHDFSDESETPGKKKRMYCHNRLENDILQAYQDRVTLKEVPSANILKPTERLVIIEPSQINDPDLIKYNTSLRMILDKKKGTYKLQVLPHTIEQGLLSNKTKVLNAVSKMLGQNGELLCPGIALTRVSPVEEAEDNPVGAGCARSKQPEQKAKKNNWLGFAPITSDSESEMSNGGDRYKGRWKILNHKLTKAPRSLTPPEISSNSSTVTPTDKLLNKLNNELRQASSQANRATSNCLIWHLPICNGKGKKVSRPGEMKWCQNCIQKMRNASSSFAEYPRVSST